MENKQSFGQAILSNIGQIKSTLLALLLLCVSGFLFYKYYDGVRDSAELYGGIAFGVVGIYFFFANDKKIDKLTNAIYSLGKKAVQSKLGK